jgi:phospholipase C
VKASCAAAEPAPEVVARTVPSTGAVLLTLTNTGRAAATVTVRANAFRTEPPRTFTVAPGQTVRAEWATAAGWYDLTAAASTADGFVRRFAGHIE